MNADEHGFQDQRRVELFAPDHDGTLKARNFRDELIPHLLSGKFGSRAQERKNMNLGAGGRGEAYRRGIFLPEVIQKHMQFSVNLGYLRYGRRRCSN